MDRRRMTGMVAMVLALVGPARGEEATDTAETRATMARIVEALGAALPLAVSRDRFEAPANRAALERALATLARDGAALAAHATGDETSFEYLGRYFAGRTATVERRFRTGETEEARFLLWMLAESCMDCHERLPSEDSPLGARLFADTTIRALEPMERVRFEVASRQFTRALDTYESLFRDRRVLPTTLDLGGHLTDYLLVALRVVDDPARARRGLETIAGRPDVSRYLAAQLRGWIVALGRLESRPPSDDLVADGRALLDEAARNSRYPADRRVLVEVVAGSARLNRWVATKRDASPKTAEAYYLLGRAEYLIHRSYGASQAEFYLEKAIRMAPGSPFAAEAYDFLEEQTIAGFEGSAGTPLPADVRERLDHLRRMVDGR